MPLSVITNATFVGDGWVHAVYFDTLSINDSYRPEYLPPDVKAACKREGFALRRLPTVAPIRQGVWAVRANVLVPSRATDELEELLSEFDLAAGHFPLLDHTARTEDIDTLLSDGSGSFVIADRIYLRKVGYFNDLGRNLVDRHIFNHPLINAIIAKRKLILEQLIALQRKFPDLDDRPLPIPTRAT